MKGVILAAGTGEALKPITDSISKPMIPILDRPMIHHAIERLSDNGILDIIIVVRENQEDIKDYLKNGDQLGVRITYIYQEGEGIDAAIGCLKGKFGNDELFVLTHCDIIANSSLLTRTLNAKENTSADMAMAVALESEIQDFGLVSLDTEGLVQKVFPDHDEQDGNYVVAGTFLLTGQIFQYLEKGIPFNECFNRFIQDGGVVAGGIWNETWIDVGRPWDILRATTYLIGKIKHSRISRGVTIQHNVEIKGPVIIETGATILNGSIIKGPVYIGKDAFIGNNSLIRECSVIGNNAKIGMGVEVRSSVIMDSASIARLSYVGASIIGPCATLHSGAMTVNSRRPAASIKTVIMGKEEIVPLQKFGAIVGPFCHIGEHTSLLPGTRVDSYAIVPPNSAIGGHVTKADN